MPMPGGWTMSMAWMRMPGQSWPAAAMMFASMWIAMMVPMMLPSLVPMLRRYRRDVDATDSVRRATLTAIVIGSVSWIFAPWRWRLPPSRSSGSRRPVHASRMPSASSPAAWRRLRSHVPRGSADQA